MSVDEEGVRRHDLKRSASDIFISCCLVPWAHKRTLQTLGQWAPGPLGLKGHPGLSLQSGTQLGLAPAGNDRCPLNQLKLFFVESFFDNLNLLHF